MKNIKLEPIPNQSFTILIDGNTWFIRLRSFRGMILADIDLNGKAIKNAVRCCPNTLLIPYKYLQENGNFIFKTKDKEYPNYKEFGVTQSLEYFTKNEIDMGALSEITN